MRRAPRPANQPQLFGLDVLKTFPKQRAAICYNCNVTRLLAVERNAGEDKMKGAEKIDLVPHLLASSNATGHGGPQAVLIISCNTEG